MTARIFDIHPHIISPDKVKYPQKPLFGVQSTWSSERPTPIEAMIEAMDAAGVDKAAIVHSSTCYGYDCSYLADSLARFPGRFTGVCSIDMVAHDNVKAAEHWLARGFTGFRVFTGGTTKGFDASALADLRSFPVWEHVSDKGLSICLQTDMTGAAAITTLAKRFPRVKIVIDHLGRPQVTDGPPYDGARNFWDLAQLPNVYMKLSTHAFDRMVAGNGTVETFMPKLVEVFTARRIAWGSNFPASDGHLTDHVAYAKRSLAVLSESDRDTIFSTTPQLLYPALADT